MKGVLLGLVVASSGIAEARDWALKGALLDSSQNLYTASYYPTSAKLRVSKRSSTNSGVWIQDFAAPSGWRFQRFFIVRRDSLGNIWVAGLQEQTSGTNTRFVIYKLTSGGTIIGTPTYLVAAPAGQPSFLGGFALDSADKPVLVGSYSNGVLTTGFATKFTTYPSAYTSQSVSVPGQHTYADDLQIDSANNVFVSSHSIGPTTDYATITKFPAAFTAGTNYSDAIPSGWYTNNGGCLTLDSSGRLTYLLYVGDGSSALEVFGTQRNTSGALTWTPGLMGLTSMDTSWSTVDASGNIYVTGTGLGGNFEVAKISPTKTVLWDTIISPSSSSSPNMIALDAGGDPLVVASTPGSGGSGWVSRVMRFSNSTGALTANYNYSGAGGFDYGYSILPSPTTGVFYVAGVGLSGSSYYPLTYKYTVGGSPVVTWSNYQAP